MTLTAIYQAGDRLDEMTLYTSDDIIYNLNVMKSRAARRAGTSPTNECRLSMHIPWNMDTSGFDSFYNLTSRVVEGLYHRDTPARQRHIRDNLYPSNLVEFSDVCGGHSRKPQGQNFIGGKLLTRLSFTDASKSVAMASVADFGRGDYHSNGIWVPLLGLFSVGPVKAARMSNDARKKNYGYKVVLDNPIPAMETIGKSFSKWNKDKIAHREMRDNLFSAAVGGFVMPLAAKGISVVYRAQSVAQAEDFMERTVEIINGTPQNYRGFF